MNVLVNGRSRDVDAGSSVAEVIGMLGLDPSYVIVERNGEPLERSRFTGVVVQEGDRLELVRAVAGG